MTMFPMLDDPNPPLATRHTLTRVHTRARILRRRRRVAAATPAVLAVGLAGAIAPRLREEPSQELTTVTSPTTAPVASTAPPTTVPYDDRGEVFELAEVPAGFYELQRRAFQDPQLGEFELMRGYAADGTSIDDGVLFTMFRYEVGTTEMQLGREQLDGVGEVEEITTPGGLEVTRQELPTTTVLIRYLDENAYLVVQAGPEVPVDLEAVMDSIVYTPPSARCFVGDEVQVGAPGCEAVNYDTL